MAINYTQGFNAGEVSRKMDGRNDLEVYKTGCRDLDNFFVLPQGGVERRAGTEFVQLAGTDGSNPARMIEFDFSSDVFYVIELGTDYAKVHYTLNGTDYVVDVTENTNINYTTDELRLVQFNRRYDTLILTCPTKQTLVLKRDTIEPTFSVQEIEFSYPPLMEENITSTEVKASSGYWRELTSATLASNVLTLEINIAGGYEVGETVAINNVGFTTTDPNGVYTVTSVNAQQNIITVDLVGGNETFTVTSDSYITDAFQGNNVLVANNKALFQKGHEDSVWGVNHLRDTDMKEISDTRTTGSEDAFSESLDVSFTNWSFETDGTWKGAITIERNIDGKGWKTYQTIGDTIDGVARNFKTASFRAEGRNTLLRVKWLLDNNTQDFKFSIKSESNYHKGLFKATKVSALDDAPTDMTYSNDNGGTLEFTFATGKGFAFMESDNNNTYGSISGVTYNDNPFPLNNKKAHYVSTYVWQFQDVGTGLTGSFDFSDAKISASTSLEGVTLSLIQGGKHNPTDGSNTFEFTSHWSEGAFSTYRGFSPASEFFENRLWFAGSKDEPADIFASQFNEIYNFNTGDQTNILSTDAIKRTIDSPEEPKWLEGKRYLFLGTAGTAVSIRSSDSDSLITQSNITTLVENAYGSAALQAEIANDVVVYVQRDKLKVRELVFDQGQDTFVGNDLNIISEDVTESGVVEMFVQKEPNQVIWCIKENGEACVMTYERGQQVRGWARINTDGKFYSAAAVHDSGEDVVWACVERTSGEDTPVTKYCIEKFHLRKDADWYVDSGKEITFGAAVGGIKEATTTNAINDDFLKFTITNHGYVNDSLVRLTNSFSGYNDKTYKVVYIDSGSFFLKDQVTEERLAITSFKQDTGAGTYVNELLLRTGSGRITDSNTRYSISVGPYEYKPFTDNGNLRWGVYGSGQLSKKSTSDTTFPWEATYEDVIGTGASSFRFFDGDSGTANVEGIQSEVTGLNHLEGKKVQVVVDGSFDSVQTVTNGKVSPVNNGNNIKAGLPYVSTLRPMPIEPALVNKISQSRVKAIAQIIVRFFKTKGAAVGEAGKQLTTYSVVDTQDPAGKPIELKTGQQRFFTASDYEREKLIEVRQDLPYPMTVLSIATHINAEGA